jgi:hypothetical protein
MAMSGATIDAALAAEMKSAPSLEVRFFVFQVFLLVVTCSGVVVPAKASAGVASEPFMMLRVCIYVCVYQVCTCFLSIPCSIFFDIKYTQYESLKDRNEYGLKLYDGEKERRAGEIKRDGH